MTKLNCDLILEGGGSRCAFTAGLLSYLNEQNLIFDSIYGVSAGSLTGGLFLTGQNKELLEALEDGALFEKEKGLIDMEQVLKGFDKKYLSVDFEDVKKSPTDFYAVVLNALTGEAEYLSCKGAGTKDEYISILAASCAVPGYAKGVNLKGNIYFDGGFTDPIPVFESYKNKKNKKIIVLTREKAYTKKHEKIAPSLEEIFEYEKVLYSMEYRYSKYNDSKSFSLYMEEKGDSIVICPEGPIDFSFNEASKDMVLSLFKEGYSKGASVVDWLRKNA